MRGREELEEDGTVHREITANSERPQGGKAANGSKVGRAGSNHAKDGGHAKGEVEGPAPTENIASKAPEHSTTQQANVLRQREEWRPGWIKFIRYGSKDKGGDNGP